MLYGDGGLTNECRMLMLSGRKRLKRVMDILGDSDDAELVTFTMTLVNKVCHSALSLRQTSSSSDASNRLHCRRTDRSIVFTRWRRCPHRRLVHGSLGPHRSNGISIGSAIIAGLADVCSTDRQTDRQTVAWHKRSCVQLSVRAQLHKKSGQVVYTAVCHGHVLVHGRARHATH